MPRRKKKPATVCRDLLRMSGWEQRASHDLLWDRSALNAHGQTPTFGLLLKMVGSVC